jgi:hypothetical protein
MEAIKWLLNGVGTLREERKRFSAQLAPDFNLFDYLRNDEMGVSRVIADLLDPKGAHGQGSVFLQAFAKTLNQEWIASTDDWRVEKERPANGRRIDVYLESNVGVIGIENKPWATDQKDQLSDYADYLKNQAANKNWLLIYLGNKEPSIKSITGEKRQALVPSGNLIFLNFHVLERWLNDCAAHSKALVVRVFIEELAKFVRTNINGELDMSEVYEVIGEIRKSEANITAAFQVSKVMTALKKGLLQSFHNELKSELTNNGFDLMWEPKMTIDGEKYVGFGVKFGRQDKFNLHIQFTDSRLKDPCWGIRRIDESVKRDNVWQGINEVMQSLFGPGHDIAQVDVWWPWISKAPDSQFNKDYINWEVSEKPWVAMNNSELVTKIVNLSLLIHRKFQEENKLYLLSSNA